MAKSAVEMTGYAKVRDQSAHGGLFSIEDDDDDIDVAQVHSNIAVSHST